ncbi:hypothetical protein [Stigmatella aurantiaca]|nr:hypothetical protein [Stigmatella aurantiaca]
MISSATASPVSSPVIAPQAPVAPAPVQPKQEAATVPSLSQPQDSFQAAPAKVAGPDLVGGTSQAVSAEAAGPQGIAVPELAGPVNKAAASNTDAFNQALRDLKETNAEVTALNAEMQIEQSRHTVLNKAIDSMNESVVKAGSTKRA